MTHPCFASVPGVTLARLPAALPWLGHDAACGFAAEQCDKWNPTAVFVDGSGVGGGVVDRLRGLGYPVRDVQAGGKARNERDYHNKTAECWGLMRDWMTTGSIDVRANCATTSGLTAIRLRRQNRLR
jgi:hypothetical protein